ncbi:MAG TPA: hypothetical protein VG963_31915 [Polyangiaceae bacterium]|nr:hypothetical protein [Polyangiaceae bacterium]
MPHRLGALILAASWLLITPHAAWAGSHHGGGHGSGSHGGGSEGGGGGHYKDGDGSSHKGGKYKNPKTDDHYQKRK